jgi:hypothetical protein
LKEGKGLALPSFFLKFESGSGNPMWPRTRNSMKSDGFCYVSFS